jgi:hypothetical protein
MDRPELGGGDFQATGHGGLLDSSFLPSMLPFVAAELAAIHQSQPARHSAVSPRARKSLMTALDEFLSASPHLRFAFMVKVDVGPIQDLGVTSAGHRRVIDILGGTVSGPRLSGTILPGGADWQVVRPGGAIDVEARYTIRADSGAHVYVRNWGVRVASPEILAALGRGETVPPASYYFRTSPRFESSDASLRWLEERIFVGVATRAATGVAIGFHEVL